MTMEDLEHHQAEWVEPISMDAYGAELNEIPPNGQGLMALISLGILKHRLKDEKLDSANSIHLQIEAQRIAYAEMAAHLSDPDYMRVTVEQLLDARYLESRAMDINMNRANPNPVALGTSNDTVYLSACDSSGLMVSMFNRTTEGLVPGSLSRGQA